ncbi:MAG: thioredoxin family protein [Phaeodactylibacter sp.]|nr:thioredoxin family protein [Phaeodactylibacter sp.]MCB9288139.1 thioredoxin family protein [Lewinellaceae bacterium]
MKKISREVVAQAMTYEAYRQLTDDLLTQGKTTGENHSEAMIHYTQLNVARMKRLDKTTRLMESVTEQLQQINRPMIWLTLTEAWCGDAAQIIPVLQKMAEASELVELRLILRDENPEIMNAFLTNGGRSIPKVILLDARTLEVLGSWGPRPAAVQEMTLAAKKDMEILTDKEAKKKRYQELTATAQKWYARDKTRSIQEEFLGEVGENLRTRARVTA